MRLQKRMAAQFQRADLSGTMLPHAAHGGSVGFDHVSEHEAAYPGNLPFINL